MINRPDIVAKVFHGKIKELLNKVVKKCHFWKIYCLHIRNSVPKKRIATFAYATVCRSKQ